MFVGTFQTLDACLKDNMTPLFSYVRKACPLYRGREYDVLSFLACNAVGSRNNIRKVQFHTVPLS